MLGSEDPTVIESLYVTLSLLSEEQRPLALTEPPMHMRPLFQPSQEGWDGCLDRKEPHMKARAEDSKAVRRERIRVRPVFTGRSNPVKGISDSVLLSNTTSARAARLAEREWRKSLSRGQRRKLRAA